ncbi:MAG: hypothetical protein QW655_03505 [Nitrososphaerota archaeon]
MGIDPYVPEQIRDYFESISGLESSIRGSFLYYHNRDTIVLVGYPIIGEFREEEFVEVLEKLRLDVRGKLVVIAPKLPSIFTFENVKKDSYFRVKLPLVLKSKKLRYMVSRAERDLVIEVGRSLSREHFNLVNIFLSRSGVEEYMKFVCSRLDRYLASSQTAYVINAYNKSGRLIGFDIVDFASTRYSFYMFNFIDRGEGYVPGVSDILFYKLVQLSQEYGKQYVNMGLGVNEGVRKFKLKWGAEEFLPYFYGEITKKKLVDLFEFFLRF